MASGGDVVRLTHKQLQTMAKKYENDASCDTAGNIVAAILVTFIG
jgi:hypothetical protein